MEIKLGLLIKRLNEFQRANLSISLLNIQSIILFSFLIRFILLVFTDNHFYGGDIFARMHFAYEMAETNLWYFGPDWLPGHFWILKLCIYLFDDFEFYARLPGVICDSTSTLFIYNITKQFFDKKTALFSALLFASHFCFILYSTITMPVSIFVTFILGGVYYFIKFQNTNSIRDFSIFTAFFTFANLLRVEAWIISFLYGLFLISINYKKFWPRIIWYAFFTTLPIIFFAYINHEIRGNWLWFIQYADLEVTVTTDTQDFSFILQETKRIFYTFPFSIFTLGALSLFVCIIKSKHRLHSVIFLIYISIVTYKYLNGSLFNDPRYFTLASVWLIIISGGGLHYFLPQLNKDRVLSVWFIIVILGLFITLPDYRKEELSQYPMQFSEANNKFMSFVRANIQSKDLIYLDFGDKAINETTIYRSKLSVKQFNCQTPRSFVYDDNFTLEYLNECLTYKNSNYIFLFPSEDNLKNLKNFLITPKGVNLLHKYNFNKIYSNGGYEIFKHIRRNE